MKINAIVESIPGNLNRHYIVEIIDDGKVIARASGDPFVKDVGQMADAARRAVSNLRYLADDAERTLIQMGILKK